MKAGLACVLLLLLAACGVSEGHRMMIGYQVNELEISALYDDGTPAQGARIEAFSGEKTIAEGITDEDGSFIIRPDKGTGEIAFVSESAGHRAELSLDLKQKGQEETASPLLRALAGLGYLLGLAGLAMIYTSRKRK
ncbi:MAG: hypothetical protein ACP5OU_00295 [Methanothrix sp.]